MSRQDYLESGYIQLREAIKRKDKQTAIYLMFQNVNVNNSKIKSHTLLHWAIIQFNDLDIITMLLDREANIHAKNHAGHKPLHVAITYRRTKAAFLLIQRGALLGEDLNALLVKAIANNSDEIVKIIIDHGLHYNPPISLKKSLKFAISKGHTKIIEHIIPHCPSLKPSERYIPYELVTGCNLGIRKNCVELLLNWNFTMNPNIRPDRRYICAAVTKGFVPIVLHLLEYGINVNMTDPETGLNLLQIACLNKHNEIVENLLKHNAFVNVTTPLSKKISPGLSNFYQHSFLRHISNNISDVTCLHIAVYNNDPMTTKYLLRYDIEIIDDPTFFNITSIAIKRNYEEIVRIFLDYGVDVYEIDPEGKTLLHYCVSSYSKLSRYKIAELLFERGAVVHVQIPGSSLLFEAIENKHHDIAHLFLTHHGNVQYISPDGNTPLHKAIKNNFNIEFIKTLLQKGVNPNAQNNNGQTPLHIACELKYGYYRAISKNITEKIQLLLQNNANIEAVDAEGETPLFSACRTANLEAVKCLLDNGANVHHTNSENLTTLYIAAKNHKKENFDIIKILFNHKVNVHCIDKFGKSLIHVAVEYHNLKLVKRLVDTQVNFNSVNKEGKTPLHIAIDSYDTSDDKMIKSLIKYGANINILDKKKQTPLQNAIKMKSFMQRKLAKHHNCFYEGGIYSGDTSVEEYNSDDYMIDINGSAKMIKFLKRHIIQLKAAGLKVNKQNFNIVYKRRNNRSSDNEFSDSDHYCYVDCRVNKLRLEIKCVQEIEKMRMKNIGANNITLYDLLKKNIHFLSRFVKNRHIKKTLKLPIYDEEFPLYIDIVRSRFRDAKFRYRLMHSAKKYFSINICLQMTDNCMDKIFSYLNIKEIKMFIRAMKPLSE